MKITYPECQIEISVDEVIELNNYYEEQKTVITCRPPELHGLNPVDFDKFRLNIKDKEWLEETLKDSLGKLHKQLLDRTDPNRHGHGIEHLIHEEPAPESQDPELEPEEAPTPTFEPGGIINTIDDKPAPKPYPNLTDHEAIIPRQDVGGPISSVRFNIGKPNPYSTKEASTPIESTKSRKHDSTKEATTSVDSTKKKKASSNPKKVEILFTTGWKTFDSISEAAEALGVNYKTFYHNLTHGKPCKTHQVRYSNPELDAALAEIEEGKKKPYQTTPPVR